MWIGRISVAQAKMAYQQAKEALNPVASISGTIQELYVHNGDSVNAGAQIAKITSSMDLSIDFLFPYASPTDFYAGQAATVYIGNYDAPVSGTVDSVSNSTSITSNGLSAVSVRVKLANPGAVSDSFTASARIGNYASYGQTPINLGGATIVYAGASGTIQGLNKLAGSTVKQGETLCTVESADARNRVENARLSLQNAELAVSMAADSLDDYNITSQITGTVIEKNFKAGDKVEGMNSGSLAVVYDMSYLKLEMAVDELDISKVEAGQSVTITADAVEGQTFTGVVDNVSINGTTAGGATSYPVTILIRHECLRNHRGRPGPQCPVHPRGRCEPGQHRDGPRPRRHERGQYRRGGCLQAGNTGSDAGQERRQFHRGHRRSGRGGHRPDPQPKH